MRIFAGTIEKKGSLYKCELQDFILPKMRDHPKSLPSWTFFFFFDGNEHWLLTVGPCWLGFTRSKFHKQAVTHSSHPISTSIKWGGWYQEKLRSQEYFKNFNLASPLEDRESEGGRERRGWCQRKVQYFIYQRLFLVFSIFSSVLRDLELKLQRTHLKVCMLIQKNTARKTI